MSLVRCVCLLSLLLASQGCEEDINLVFPVRVWVHSESGEPLPFAEVRGNGLMLGKTANKGNLDLLIRKVPGERVLFEPKCPEGYGNPIEDTVVVLRPVFNKNNQQIPLKINLTCVPKIRKNVVLVHLSASNSQPSLLELMKTRLAGLPVLVDGKEAGRTDVAGVLHLPLDREQGQEVEVTVNTQSIPNYRPQYPTIKVITTAEDNVYVLDQTFISKEEQARDAVEAGVSTTGSPRRRRVFRPVNGSSVSSTGTLPLPVGSKKR